MAEKTVVLVHGAFADGSSWDEVIPLLQDAFQAFGHHLAVALYRGRSRERES